MRAAAVTHAYTFPPFTTRNRITAPGRSGGYPSTYETLTELGTNPGASGVVWADFIFTQRRMVYWWQITEGSSFATVERT